MAGRPSNCVDKSDFTSIGGSGTAASPSTEPFRTLALGAVVRVAVAAVVAAHERLHTGTFVCGDTDGR